MVRREGPARARVGLKREHAPLHAPLLAWPLLALLSLQSRGLDDPLTTLLTLGALATFAVFCWTIIKMERQLNAEGESLFRPWKVRSPRKHAKRIDGILSTSIRRLRSGEDEVEVLSTLRLHLKGRLHGEAGRHYRRAADRLRDAAGRHWVFDKDRREASLEEAVNELWMARAEYLKEMIE